MIVGLKSNEQIKSKHLFINISQPSISDRMINIEDDDSIERHLIVIVHRDGLFIQQPKFLFVSLKHVLHGGRKSSRFFIKFSVCTSPFCVPFVSLCLQLISASIEYLISKSDRKNWKKSSFELHFRLRKFGMKSLASGD